MAIKRMRKQCVPGALSPPPPRLGTRLDLSVVGQMEKSLATFRTEYLTRVVSNDMIDKLFTAKSLDEQNHTFQQLPLDKMEEALRYAGKFYLTSPHAVFSPLP